MQNGLQSKAISMILNIVVISTICTLQQFYPPTSISRSAMAATSSSEEDILSIMAVGDSIGYNIDSRKLTNLSQIIKNPDIFIFNLEGVLIESPENAKKCTGFPAYQSIFVGNSSFVRHLRLAPITVANLANNHIFDCGSEGIKETKKILDEHGILSVGAGQNLQEACEPLSVESKGKTITFVSYNFMIRDLISAGFNRSGAAAMDLCSHDYNHLKGSDIVIASIHLGYWSANVTERQVSVIQGLFDSGVDIVIGHSPHIPQAIATTEAGNLAFFSIGNFILNPDHLMPPLAHTSIVPRLDIYTRNNTMNLTVYPISIDNEGIPHLVENNNNTIISRLVKDSDNFYTSINIRDNLGQVSVIPK